MGQTKHDLKLELSASYRRYNALIEKSAEQRTESEQRIKQLETKLAEVEKQRSEDLVVANKAYYNVEAWRSAVRAEAEPDLNSADLARRTKARIELHMAKETANRACLELLGAVDAWVFNGNG